MKNSAALIALLLCFSATLSAQPQPCGPNPEMTPLCKDACIICDIDGFTGINNDGIQGQAPPGFCTGTVHHMQWIGFIAGSTNLTLSISVFNCQTGEGLEVGIYKSLDCQTFELVTNCDGDIAANTTQTFTNIVPLTIGQYYYFVMDGNHDDVCHYTIHVVSGSTQVMPLENSGSIIGPDTVCINTPNAFTASLPPGAARFEWTLNGQSFATSTDTTVSLNFPVEGLNQLCVTASNTCDTAAPSCRNIYVHNIPVTELPVKICAGECYTYHDSIICDAGSYDFHLQGLKGCDSLVHVSVEVLQSLSSNLDLFLCEGDSVWIGGTPFSQTGQYQQHVLSYNGCDSLVNLSLQIIQCEIQGQLNANPVKCAGETSGSLSFSVSNGTPPFNYIWQRIGGGPSGTGTVNALYVPEVVTGLPAGSYAILVKDDFGNDVAFFKDIKEPPALSFAVEKSEFHGFNLSCKGATDGSITADLSGGTPAYQYAWSNGSSAKSLQNLSAGAYTCTVTDAQGCTVVQPIALAEPPALALEAKFDNPGCDGETTGEARVLATTGGVLPYEYELSGGGFGTETIFKDLPPGAYTLTARDANGCETMTSAILVAPLIPHIELGQDLSVKLAESAQILLTHDTPLDSFAWQLNPGLSCYNCPQPIATPYETTTYTLTAEAPGGCTDTDSLTVFVQKVRDVYIPNIFTPNDDGENDYFTVYSGPEVQEVKLEVYSRWGELLYRNIGAANDEPKGWDGTYRGDPVSPGVFVFRAEVLFVDGVKLSYEGNVTVLR